MSFEILLVCFAACWFFVGLLTGFIVFTRIDWLSVREWLKEQVMAK